MPTITLEGDANGGATSGGCCIRKPANINGMMQTREETPQRDSILLVSSKSLLLVAIEAEPCKKIDRVVPASSTQHVLNPPVLMISGKRKGLLEFGLRTACRGGGMADAADLKSVVRRLT